MSSRRPASSTRSTDIVDFGQKLIVELGLDKGVDTLGRWLAHYIADLLARAKAANGREKAILEAECFDRILALWTHRRQLKQPAPMGSFDAIVDLLRSLADSDRPRYFRPEKVQADPTLKRRLATLQNFDAGAKQLMDYFLSAATATALHADRRWLLSEVMKMDKSIEAKAANELIDRMRKDDAEKAQESIEKLALFEAASRELRTELLARQKLGHGSKVRREGE